MTTSSKYAVIRLKGHQHKVSEGDEFLVDKLNDEKPEPEVLLVVEGEMVKIGNPIVKDSKVKLEVLNKEEKGEKLTILKYKAKSRYRKKLGFRHKHSRVKVQKITS